jgi:TRAP-type C4-dicarboxylate transport system substrate-binding protein
MTFISASSLATYDEELKAKATPYCFRSEENRETRLENFF